MAFLVGVFGATGVDSVCLVRITCNDYFRGGGGKALLSSWESSALATMRAFAGGSTFLLGVGVKLW